MGCLFTCFRVRENKRHLPKTTTLPPSRHTKPNDVVVSRNRLSSLFLSEEGEDNVGHNGKNFDEGSQRDDRELKDEAKFLKACGTIASTPDKIQKASEKLKVSPSYSKDSGPPKFRSWLLDSSAQNVPIDVQPFNPPTPKKQCEEWEKRTECSDHTPSSCISNAHNTQWDHLDSTEGSGSGSCHPSDGTEMNMASVSPWPSTTYTKERNRSTHFECETEISSCESSDYSGWHMKNTESPNPTPIKLSEGMQTPGTVYPAISKELPNGKPQVMSQFVYPTSSLGEDISKSKILEEEEPISVQDSRKLSESSEQSQNATSTPDKGLNKMPCENEFKVEESLSSWLKPASVILEERSKKMEMGYIHVRKTPADRPIIGMVAAHWIEDEHSDVPPPKWWDGNGIPNSTNKYKEDQKVSWHATPFEERLEKALSEETVISKRKDVCGKPIAFDESEESDTALSQLKSSTHSQSVVSF
ncbi:protein JASON-like isoform X2 [Cicer arietinum]|uniref:Protein JASON-like isoform X2 n=1 Tax=Cicer arietinum TaxID=3827 RepID=A0A1S2Y658_CICAR|nr:protein JASON-like isoform X2 [Cicer arietinum]